MFKCAGSYTRIQCIKSSFGTKRTYNLILFYLNIVIFSNNYQILEHLVQVLLETQMEEGKENKKSMLGWKPITKVWANILAT